jgi:DNA-binding GntR family transcriptional regulator
LASGRVFYLTFFHNESLRKKLYSYIKQKINDGELHPGDLINQKEISETLGISRTPYRDCMIQLESEGLVRIIPCRGVVVREITIEEAMESQEVGGALEAMAYELAFYNARENCVERLTDIVEEVEACAADDAVIDLVEKNMEFHRLVLRQCPNKTIVEELEKNRERIYDFPRRDQTPIQKWEQRFWQEHRRQIEILKNGTPKELGEYTRDVHWNVSGKEEYWELLFHLPKGAVKQYFEERKPKG